MTTPSKGKGASAEAEKLRKRKRSLQENLKEPLNPQVGDIVRTNARMTINNVKLVRSGKNLKGKLPVSRDQSRQLAINIFHSLEQVKRQRLRLASLQGPPLADEASDLTYDGQDESVKEAFRELVGLENDERDFAQPFGPRKGMVSAEPGEVRALNPGLKIGAQTLQLLGHFSQIFMNKVSDMEYQSMLVNNRIFVASNARAAIESFADQHVADFLEEAAKTIAAENAPSDQERAYRIGALSTVLKLDKASAAPLTPQQSDGAAMLSEYEVGHHVDYPSRKDLQSALNVLQHQARNKIKMCGPFTPEMAAGYVTAGKTYDVIGVETETKGGWHAEQLLAMTLIQAGWKKQVPISGTKLPCYTCWMTLGLLNACGYRVTYTDAPGFFWECNTVPGLTQIAKALNVTTVSQLLGYFKDIQKRLTESQFTQFMTALTTQSDLEVDVSLPGKKLKAKGLTQDQSQKSFSFKVQAPDEEQYFDGPVPGSPRGYWGSDDESSDTGGTATVHVKDAD